MAQMNASHVSNPQNRNYAQIDGEESTDRIPDVPLGRGGRPKRTRTKFTPFQIFELQEKFAENSSLRRPGQAELAQSLKLDVRVVVVWYNNRRSAKKKRERAAMTEASTSSQSNSVKASQASTSSQSNSVEASADEVAVDASKTASVCMMNYCEPCEFCEYTKQTFDVSIYPDFVGDTDEYNTFISDIGWATSP
ncbi:homeobox protein Hox-B1-like [Contarinia nasturtii]|uniref:homeobox protein Hox-B1-like n=1 Tax=Contarinia nasturtii TaxID=265458 RepID=UPI0012D4487A|nr:homeobox protein Hox-B1-like [Contarinia nasturtii]